MRKRGIGLGAALLAIGVALTATACAGDPNDSESELAASRAVDSALRDDVEALGLDHTVYGTVTEDEGDTGDRFTLFVSYQFPGDDINADAQMREVAREVWFAYPNELIYLDIEGRYDTARRPWEFTLSPQELEQMYGPRPEEDTAGDGFWTAVLLLGAIAAALAVAMLAAIGRGMWRARRNRTSPKPKTPAEDNGTRETAAQRQEVDKPAPVADERRPVRSPATRRRRNTRRRRASSTTTPGERAFAFQNVYADLDRLAPPRSEEFTAAARDRVIAEKVRARPDEIRRLRLLRNKIAHGEPYSDDDVRDALELASTIRSRVPRTSADRPGRDNSGNRR